MRAALQWCVRDYSGHVVVASVARVAKVAANVCNRIAGGTNWRRDLRAGVTIATGCLLAPGSDPELPLP